MPHAWTSPADPIHAAIERHRAAYDAFQVAPEGEPSLIANDEYDAATEALVSTACATRFGALALVGYLRQWLADEAEFKAGYQPGYGIAEARVADLTLFLGTHLPPAVIPQWIPPAAPSGRLGMPRSTRALPATHLQRRDTVAALRDEDMPGAIEDWQAVAAIRPDTAHVRAPRFLDVVGEALAAVAIVGGGIGLTGLATLL